MADTGAAGALAALLPHADPLKADGFGVTPLMAAGREGNPKAVELLVAGSQQGALDADKMDALMLVARSSKFEYGSKKVGTRIVRMLVAGSDQSRLCSKGKSAFEYALEGADGSSGTKEAALLLMDGVDANGRDGSGRSLIESVDALLAGKASKGWWMSEMERRAISGQTGQVPSGKRGALRL